MRQPLKPASMFRETLAPQGRDLQSAISKLGGRRLHCQVPPGKAARSPVTLVLRPYMGGTVLLCLFFFFYSNRAPTSAPSPRARYLGPPAAAPQKAGAQRTRSASRCRGEAVARSPGLASHSSRPTKPAHGGRLRLCQTPPGLNGLRRPAYTASSSGHPPHPAESCSCVGSAPMHSSDRGVRLPTGAIRLIPGVPDPRPPQGGNRVTGPATRTRMIG
ncbi:hypothetical protein NDU88_002677 [Pleurodeles waltl]|uniref:Uncharacterized protein n=1 Tax=Pleurodeles waltl TaxID=8319 RepID=A0AAV7SCQ8_PLEWA|nr:hypothetical protein NDU88_002677 [Pleurodeles waltl]